MTVYVVTSGCYSDFHIEALFSTKELAEQFVKNNIPPDEDYWEGYDIKEYEVDSSDKKTEFVKRYTYHVRLDNGEFFIHPLLSVEDWVEKSVVGGFRGSFSIMESASPSYSEGISRVSLEHAKKLAVEGRQHWLRSEKYYRRIRSGEFNERDELVNVE